MASFKLVLTLILLSFCNYSSVQGIIFYQRTHIYIYNKLYPGTPLNIHCKSKDNDLGPQVIPYGDDLTWSFVNNGWGTTLFWCFMGWRNGQGEYISGSFEVYNYDRDHANFEKNVVWNVQGDGLFMYDPGPRQFPRKMFPPQQMYWWP